MKAKTPAHSLMRAQHRHTLPAHSHAPTCTHGTACVHLACLHPLSAHTCVSMQCTAQMCSQPVHTHTSALINACSAAHAPYHARCSACCCLLHLPAQPGGRHQPPLLLFNTRSGHVLSLLQNPSAIDPSSCLALLPSLERLCWDLSALGA